MKNQSKWEKKFLGINLEGINRMGTNIPGFQLIKDRVIKPLLVATERIVEYYMPNEQPLSSMIKYKSDQADIHEDQPGEYL